MFISDSSLWLPFSCLTAGGPCAPSKKKKKFNYIEDQILFETTASEDNSYHLLATLVCQLTPSRAIIQKIL